VHITILTIPDKEWTTNDAPYKTIFDDTHVIIHFPPDTIIYTEPTIPTELNKEPHIKILAVRILCIHHKNTTIEIPNLKTKLLQITNKFPLQYCYYTNGSFNPPKQQTNRMCDPAQAGYGIWNPLLKINLPQRLIRLQNILRAEISAIHHSLQILIQEFPNEPAQIFTDSLNSLYLINT
jgi:hypothetical protein